MGQPDLMAGADFGRDGGEFQRQFLDQGLAQCRLELGREPVAADQAGAVEPDVEIAENIARPQAARPFLEPVEMSRGIGAADHSPDRGADHHIGDDAVRHQRPDNADVGKSARSAAAQGQPDHRPPGAAEANLVGGYQGRSGRGRSGFPAPKGLHGCVKLVTAADSCQNALRAWFIPIRLGRNMTGPRRGSACQA